MSVLESQFFCSWSGGKDSCLSLYRAIKDGGKPSALFTMMMDHGIKTASHHVPLSVMKEQARSLGIPLVTRASTPKSYETIFTSAIELFRTESIQAGVFGDIDIRERFEWVERVCAKANITPYQPLKKMNRYDILMEFINSGFRAIIISVKEGELGNEYLGRILDLELVKEIESIGIDPSGEEGEFHTFVIDGPIFEFPVDYKPVDQIYSNGYWFQYISL